MKPVLFEAAAAIAFVSALHHVHRGMKELDPTWRILSAIPRRAALSGWNYMSVSYALTSACPSGSLLERQTVNN